MNYPEDLKYAANHEWARVEDGKVRMGISDYAQDALGDVVYVDLPTVGSEVGQGDAFAEVESTKSVSDLFAPVRAEIVSRSGGGNYDGLPGDDGVTVYLRLLDAEGDAVKVPGRITVQLLDNERLGAPRLLGLYRFDDVDRSHDHNGRCSTGRPDDRIDTGRSG